MTNWLADIDKEEIESNLSTAADNESSVHLQTPLDKSRHYHNNDSFSTPTLTSPYSSPLKILQTCLTASPLEVEKGSAIQIAISIDDDTKTRRDIQTIIQTIVPTIFAYGDEEAEIEMDKAKYPILHALGVPLRNSLMSRLLGELVALQDDKGKEIPVLVAESRNGRKRILVPAPQIGTSETFRKLGTEAIDSFIDAMVQQSQIVEAVAAETLVLAEDQQTEDEIQKIMNTRFVAEVNKLVSRTIVYFANSNPDQFFAAGKKAGFLMEAPKMNVFTAIAFQQATNVSIEQLRIINRYLTKTIGSRIMPSERAIKAEVPDDNPPEIIETEHEGIKYKWFVKSFPHVISSRVSKKLSKPKNRELDGNHLVAADIIYSGDHGQRTFKLGFKVILHFENGETVEAVETLGDMECKKDSYKVLMETMGSAMNNGLQKLLKSDKKQGKDWYISVEDEVVMIEIPQTEEEIAAAARDEGKKKVTTRIRVTGDLAFYAIMLGKVNMDSLWCNWCKFYCNQDWNFGDDAGFEMWTKASIAEWFGKVLIDDRLRNQKCPVVTGAVLLQSQY